MFSNRPVTASSGLVTRSDENAVVASSVKKSTMNADAGKTPARSSKTRRAFGDISNRKGPKTVGPGLGKTADQGLGSRAGAVKTPFASSAKASTKTPFETKKAAAQSTVKNRVDFILPDSTVEEEPIEDRAPKVEAKDASLLDDDESVEPIELPAGRTWLQQLENGDLDSDDDSVVSWEGAKTLRQDYEELAWKRHDQRMKWEEEEEQRMAREWERTAAEVMAQDELPEPVDYFDTFNVDIELADSLDEISLPEIPI